MTSPQETNGLYEVRTIAQYDILKLKVPSLHKVINASCLCACTSNGGCTDDCEEGQFLCASRRLNMDFLELFTALLTHTDWFFDTVMYRHDYEFAGKKRCKVRFRFANFDGLIAVHCHMPQHEDQGAIGVANGPTQLYFPSVRNCVTPPCDEPVDITLIFSQWCTIFFSSAFLFLPKCTVGVVESFPIW